MAWMSGNRYLTKIEMRINALEVYNYFSALGWSLNAICALLGNMETESTINPGIWEGLKVDTSRGYGLVQWTPATKYIDWAGEGYEDGYKQCERIQYEVDNGLQWFSNPSVTMPDPPITFKEFTVSELDVTTLANYFLWYYEHPKEFYQPIRGEQAREWYTYLTGVIPEPPTPIIKKKKMPIYMMCRRITF